MFKAGELVAPKTVLSFTRPISAQLVFAVDLSTEEQGNVEQFYTTWGGSRHP